MKYDIKYILFILLAKLGLIIFWLVLIAIILGVIASVVQCSIEINEKGLKGLLEEIWYGKGS